ncbi:Store-operated calcium entry-associated regulatory factor, partial [Lachnellula willkommii]
MQLLTFLYPTLFALLLTPSPISAAAAGKVPKNAILLSNVKSLTLRENAKTSHRRVSAIPQLTCKGPACAHHHIEIMRCTNAGADYNTEDIQWSCSASVPADFKLGATDVICEGYSSPDDDYVLKGSCGVEYRLLYTEAGEEKYGGGTGGWFGGGGGKGKGKGKGKEEGEAWTIDGIIFTV